MQTGGEGAALDVDHPDDADVSDVLRALAQRFLSRTKQNEARLVLDSLGVIQHRARVLAFIDHNARRAAPSGPDGRRVGPPTSEPGQSRRW